MSLLPKPAKTMKFFRSKLWTLLTLVCFLPSCAVKSHQFAHAVYKGNTDSARSFHESGFARMKFSVVESPKEYSLPIQYAILQKNKPMAKFLVENGSPNILQGKNLAYYCSYNRKDEMANYFASIGEGNVRDIRRAKHDLVENQRRNRAAAKTTALIGLLFLGAIISSSGNGSGSSGYSVQDTVVAIKSDSTVPAGLRAGL